MAKAVGSSRLMVVLSIMEKMQENGTITFSSIIATVKSEQLTVDTLPYVKKVC